VTPSPFSSLPPTITEINPPSAAPPSPTINLPPYTPRQKELSDLRSQALQLEKEREKLIEEIKQKKSAARYSYHKERHSQSCAAAARNPKR
jgi:hypothetical protein